MDDKLKHMPDFDDLIFELRNKDYGAYQLRKRYKSVVIGCIILSSLIFSLSMIIPFLLTQKSDRILNRGVRTVQIQMENLDTPIDQLIVPPPPPPPETPHVQEIAKYTPPEVVDTVFPFEPQLATVDEILSQKSNDMVEATGTGSGDDLLNEGFGEETNEPFFMVETMPTFRGGDLNKFRDWVIQRTNYPQEAIDKKIQGRVFLTFIVETDGSISSVTIVKGVDPIIDDEAVKAIQASPKWSPGLQRGKPVRVRYSMSLLFVF